MTIEELLGKSADELDAMSAAEREAYFAPFLAVTRPDRAVIVEAVQKGYQGTIWAGRSKKNIISPKE